MALGYLFGGEFLAAGAVEQPFLDRLDASEVALVARMVSRGVNSPRASSAGRLFDAVSSLLGVCDDAGYEGEAAIMLEAAAGSSPAGGGSLPWRLTDVDGLWVYDWGGTLAALTQGVADGVPVPALAAAFHRTIVAVTVEMCVRAAARTGVVDVCLSGGCLQNGLLATELPAALGAAGLVAYLNRDVPANDGGISYGQAVVAAAQLREGGSPGCASVFQGR
jgi:hydrogenase maturation protein HypF